MVEFRGECNSDEEPVRRGTREGCGELGLGFEDDLKCGVRQRCNESTGWVDQEFVRRGRLDFVGCWGGGAEGPEPYVGTALGA